MDRTVKKELCQGLFALSNRTIFLTIIKPVEELLCAKRTWSSEQLVYSPDILRHLRLLLETALELEQSSKSGRHL